jgi:hypothetical protein
MENRGRGSNHPEQRPYVYDSTLSGLQHAACLLAPSSFILPWLGVHVTFASDPLARLWSSRT